MSSMAESSEKRSWLNFSRKTLEKPAHTGPKVGDELSDIVFEERQKEEKTEYASPGPAGVRKIIKIVGKESRPNPGVPYRVRVIEDTKPDDPTKGELRVVIIPADGSFTKEQWMNVEDQVNKAEKKVRMAKRASADLYDWTTVPKHVRKEEGHAFEQGSMERFTQDSKGAFEEEASELLGKETSPEQTLVAERKGKVVEALRSVRDIRNAIEAFRAQEVHVLEEQRERPGGTALAILTQLREEIAKKEGEYAALRDSNPEAFVALHLKELKEFRTSLEKGEIAETPSVRAHMDDIIGHLSETPVFIHGHLGSGKTELAMHTAREYMRAAHADSKEREAIVISGAKDISLAELYGHQALSIDRIDKDEIKKFIDEVEKEFEAWKDEHKDASEQDREFAHDRILQVHSRRLEGGTISDFLLGPVYKAMEQGCVLIIDEVNAIPHEVLISLNHILTRKVGDKVIVQQNSGREITIQPGFGIMLTGNLNQGGQDVYRVGRQEMDPALLSRLYKIEYDYLPQTTEGTLSDRTTLEKRELFHLMLATLMDRTGNLEVPQNAPQQLWNLAKASRIIQDVFSRKEVNNAFYFQEGGGRATPYYLHESVASIRALRRILEQWQRRGFEYELDHYLYTEFVGQSTDVTDRAYLYQLLKDRFGFFQTPGWKENPDYGTAGNVKNFSIQVPKNRPPGGPVFMTSRQTTALAFGSPPERKEWPKK